MPAKRSLGRVLCELFSGELLASFVRSVKERMCLDGVPVSDGDVRMVFVMSALISGGFCSCLDDYDGTLSIPRAWQT